MMHSIQVIVELSCCCGGGEEVEEEDRVCNHSQFLVLISTCSLYNF